MPEYRILTEKDSTFGGKYDAQALEDTLNEHAAAGWRVVNGFSIPNLKLGSGQLMFVLERPTP